MKSRNADRKGTEALEISQNLRETINAACSILAALTKENSDRRLDIHHVSAITVSWPEKA
jgi:hypothetical protein